MFRTYGEMDSELRAALSSLLPGMPIFVRTLSTRDIAGYTLLRDIYGKPGLILKVTVPRNAYLLGQSDLYFFYGGQEDDVWRDIVLSLRDAHSEN